MNNTKIFIKNLINFLIHLVVKMKHDDIFALSSQLAYYLILSFFPFIIFLMTLVGFSNMESNEVIIALSGILPDSIVELTKSIIMEVFDNQYTGLLGFSIILALWTSASGFRAVIKGVNKAYNFKETRSFTKRILISMAGIIGLAIIIILALTVVVFGRIIGSYLEKNFYYYNVIVFIWSIFRYGFIFFIMIFIFSLIYSIAPAKRLRVKQVIPGAVFSTFGWGLVSMFFSFYINNFRNFSRFYGSLGAVFILITWLFLISFIFILGVEINVVLEKIKRKHQ